MEQKKKETVEVKEERGTRNLGIISQIGVVLFAIFAFIVLVGLLILGINLGPSAGFP